MATKNNKNLRECDICEECKTDVKTRIDPFTAEINNEIIERNFCDECFHQRAGDV